METNEVTIKLEALKLSTLLKIIQRLAGNELENTAGHTITLKFTDVGTDDLSVFADSIEKYLKTQTQVKAKITIKSSREVSALPPPTDKTEPFNMFIVRPRRDDDRN